MKLKQKTRSESFLFFLIFEGQCNVCPGFQSQCKSSCLHTLSPVCNLFLRVTSGMIPAELLVASMAVSHLYPYTCLQPLVGLKSMIELPLSHIV